MKIDFETPVAYPNAVGIHITALLAGHTSPETAYVVNDYPYGFRLRCKIRYWVEFSPKHGARMCSQTSNPKVAGEVWNKPKKTTYYPVAGAMYLDGANHVKFGGLHCYMDADETAKWLRVFSPALDDDQMRSAAQWLSVKRRYARLMKDGLEYTDAGKLATLASMKGWTHAESMDFWRPAKAGTGLVKGQATQ